MTLESLCVLRTALPLKSLLSLAIIYSFHVAYIALVLLS